MRYFPPLNPARNWLYCTGVAFIKLSILTLQRKIKAICTRADRKGSLYFSDISAICYFMGTCTFILPYVQNHSYFLKAAWKPRESSGKIQWQLYEGLGKLSPFWMCCDTIEDGVLCHHRKRKSNEDRRWNSWTGFLVEVLDINLSFLRLKFWAPGRGMSTEYRHG
jgi:hypothetical protein